MNATGKVYEGGKLFTYYRKQSNDYLRRLLSAYLGRPQTPELSRKIWLLESALQERGAAVTIG